MTTAWHGTRLDLPALHCLRAGRKGWEVCTQGLAQPQRLIRRVDTWRGLGHRMSTMPVAPAVSRCPLDACAISLTGAAAEGRVTLPLITLGAWICSTAAFGHQNTCPDLRRSTCGRSPPRRAARFIHRSRGWSADPAAAARRRFPEFSFLNRRSWNGASRPLHPSISRSTRLARQGLRLFLSATGSRPRLADRSPRAHDQSPYSTEDALYASTASFIGPELRHGSGEIEAASGALPSLVERPRCVATSTCTRPIATVATSSKTMVAACHALGYHYMAITDHSSGAAASRTLALDEYRRQRDGSIGCARCYPADDHLPRHRGRHPREWQPRFRRRRPSKFDIVLASLHDPAGQDAARLTRAAGAIRHPLVNVLCHPANRLVGHSADMRSTSRRCSPAAETGTALEVDGAPSHIDLEGERARAAIAAGVTLSIDSDCHRVEALGRQMSFGIGTARRGWVEPRHVLNTRPSPTSWSSFAAKRGRPA